MSADLLPAFRPARNPCNRERIIGQKRPPLPQRVRSIRVRLEPSAHGTCSMRCTRVAQIDKKSGNLRAVQLLPGRARMDSRVGTLGVDIGDALTLSKGNILKGGCDLRALAAPVA